MSKYTIVNDLDGNETFKVEAATPGDAAEKALLELGWYVSKAKVDIEEDEAEVQRRDEKHGLYGEYEDATN